VHLEYVARPQLGREKVIAVNRTQLERVADEDDLDAAKWEKVFADELEKL
jgi:hypothetical protein